MSDPKLWFMIGCHDMRLSEHVEGDGATVYQHAAALGCEGTVSKRKGSRYVSGRSLDWIKTKNPDAPATRREVEGLEPVRALGRPHSPYRAA
jgi:ATP-dependent DNA ligase